VKEEIMEQVATQLREARDQIHDVLLGLECLQNIIDEIGNIDGIDGVDDLRDALDRISDDVRGAVEPVDCIRRGINRLADNLPAPEQQELAL
jgi:hypothetical protein